MRLKELAKKCDAIVLPAYINDSNDLFRIAHLQRLNSNFNHLFDKTIICINYKSPEVKEQLLKKVEAIFNDHFNNIDFIHNDINYENVRSLCEQEETLIQECKSRGYNYICKTMDHVIILEEALDIILDENKDFYFTCGVGAQRCIEKNNDVNHIYETEFFPQTNFYFLDVSKMDYIYNLEEVEQKHLEWEADNSVCPNGYFICCEDQTAKMALRNNLNKQDIIPEDKFKELIQNVIDRRIADPSYKNLSTCGIIHLQYPEQPVYKLV
tara:strand:+ start:778 stop:1581 length:804 start_codon:yes stop_codon:yes gene_type:complete